MCSQNSARSQLAESYWRSISDIPALSAGTRPARRVHPGAVSVARRHGLDLTHATPKLARDVLTGDELLIAVCDRAYEDVDGPLLHWSIPDPAVKEDPMPSTPPTTTSPNASTDSHQALKESHDDRPPCSGTQLGGSAP